MSDFPPPSMVHPSFRVRQDLYADGYTLIQSDGELPPPRLDTPWFPRVASLAIDVTATTCEIRVIKYDRTTGDVIHDAVH